jgi:hypothetical protein
MDTVYVCPPCLEAKLNSIHEMLSDLTQLSFSLLRFVLH